LSPYAFQSGAERLLVHAVRHQEEFALLSLSISAGDAGSDRMLSGLRRAIRQTDLLACTGADEFTIVTSSLDAAAALAFAERLCEAARAVPGVERGANADAAIRCGFATLADASTKPGVAPGLHELWDAARRRSQAGVEHGCSGAGGAAEESASISQ
jgi:GGDEF domain-containing protein